MRRQLARVLPKSIVGFLRHVRSGGLFSMDAQMSFSQEGEDLIIARIIGDQDTGFYVDVGAHHPTRFSNTYRLYRRGWRGINIDATPGSMAPFLKTRRRDINLEIAISLHAGSNLLYLFDEPALNSLSRDLSASREAGSDYKIVGQVEVTSMPLREVLSTHLPADVSTIDLMSIDVEGHDFEVLQSNDWSRFRPRVLVIEKLRRSLGELLTSREVRFLESHGYVIHSRLYGSVILIEQSDVHD